MLLPRMILALALVATLGCTLSQGPPVSESAAPQPAAWASTLCSSPQSCPVSFQAHVLPLLVKRCSPCHFQGGSMYARLPFDREATLRQLGDKLFTRIQKEDEQALLRMFLAQGNPDASPTPPPPETFHQR